MNSVVLIGRLAKDVEVAKTKSGTSVARMCIAVNRDYHKEGEPEADFINLLAWSKTADLCGQYLHKGSQCAVHGALQVRPFTGKDGKNQYFTEVVINQVQFLDSKPKEKTADISNDEMPF